MDRTCICWIDDSPKLMEKVAESKFKRFWEQNIDCSVIFFGDNYKEYEIAPELGDEFFEYFKDLLHNLSAEFQKSLRVDKRSKSMFYPDYEKVKLIQTNKFKYIVNDWKNLSSNNFSKDKFDKQIGDLVDEFRNSFENTTCFGLDITLLYNDVGRVSYQDVPIISMAIYSYLITHNIPCFLYSTYIYDMSYINKWKEIYKRNFSNNDNNTYEIFNRLEMLKGDDKIVEKIIGLISSFGEEGSDEV